MTDEQEIFTAAQLREHQDGYQARENRETLPHTAIVRDPKIERALSVRAIHYDPQSADRPDQMPGHAKDLEKHRQIQLIEGTQVARKALETGDMATVKHLTGDTNQRADVSGIQAIGNVDDLVTGPASIIYIYAEPGSGKTDFALLLGQRWMHHQPRESLVASNIQTLEETTEWTDGEGRLRDGWIANYGALDEWIKQDGEPTENEQTPKLFIFDEASSHAAGGGAQGYETRQKMGPLVYKIRKYGGSLIIIGHDGGDVHPMVREQAKVVKKDGKKEATIYDSIRNRKPQGEIAGITGIPPTDWRFDTHEATAWSWQDLRSDDENDGLDETEAVEQAAIYTVIRAKQQGMSNRQVAKFVPWSHETVRKRWNEYQNDGLHTDTVANVEGVIA
ncbi:hypothetical protein [Halovivax limisalsi]|uniref:hypothetical protein n=1 Tax=Halovivax limisalsi TaxID=1453760 RepID=UPI001FFCBAC9|nr:hypothetical protein [Halovivax limisalsi]